MAEYEITDVEFAPKDDDNWNVCDHCGRLVAYHLQKADGRMFCIDYTNRGEVMKTPVSAAQGTEAGHLNTPQRDGTGAVPGDESTGTEAQATQPFAAPTECNCPERACDPGDNVGHYCWRTGCPIYARDFADRDGG